MEGFVGIIIRLICLFFDFLTKLLIRGYPHLSKYMLDSEASKKFISDDPAKDLEIDQAFGMPLISPTVPGQMTPAAITPHLNGYMGDAAAGALMQDIRQRQQLAAFQLMAASGVPGAALGLGGLNPALMGGVRAAIPTAPMALAAPAPDQQNSSTPISNYLANSTQNSGPKAGPRSEAV